jgi:hypothetical protein
MAIIPKPSLVQYEALFDVSRQSKDARKRHHEFVMDNVDHDQHSAVGVGFVLKYQMPMAVMAIL